jgi:uncharacterized membrane protein
LSTRLGAFGAGRAPAGFRLGPFSASRALGNPVRGGKTPAGLNIQSILTGMGQTRGPGRSYNQLAGTSVERLAGISDGIFSVGMTLLVLGLVVPTLSAASATNSELWNALAKLGPNVLVYVMSFMTLGIFWVGQGTQMGQLARSNRHYVWIQLTFLLAVTLVPFSTALLAHFPTLQLALVEYWLNIVLLGGTLLAGVEYALRAHLLQETEQRELAQLFRGRILIAQALYALATALSIFFSTWVSIALIVLIQLNYVIAPRIPILRRF